MAAINPYTPVQIIQVPERPVAISGRTDRGVPMREARAAPPRSDLTARLDNLISGEVADGRLTASQADELRGLFRDVFAQVANRPLQPGAPLSKSDAKALDSPFSIDNVALSNFDAAASASARTEVEGTANVMQEFLDALQAALDSSAAATYGPSGQNNVAAIKTVPPLLVDYRT